MRPRQAFGQLPVSRSRWPRLPLVPSALTLGALMVLGCVPGAERHQASAPPRWTSRAIPEAKGEVREVDGKRVQVRYKDDAFSAITANFEQWPTYAYDDTRKFPPPNRISMPVVKGDPRRGRELFRARDKAPCTGCHLIPGDDIWPAGSVGPDLSVIGDRRLPDQYLFDFVWDARLFLPNPTMPPWGTSGILSPEETVHIVAFLQTLKGSRHSSRRRRRTPRGTPTPVRASRSTGATTSTRLTTRRYSWRRRAWRCGLRKDPRARRAPIATRAAWRRP